MGGNFDLLGDPIPEGWGKRGRPPHLPTQGNRNKIMLLLALGWSNERIARALCITLPTLKKHYFAELKVREEARDRMDARLAEKLFGLGMDGNVGAIKEFRKLVERNDLMEDGRRFTRPEPSAKAPKPPKLGKKEQADIDARQIPQGSGWDSLIRH